VQADAVDVLIRLERQEPPAGTVVPLSEAAGATVAHAFVGWLGLLRALAEIVDDADEPNGG
jgi:hypothetical protein